MTKQKTPPPPKPPLFEDKTATDCNNNCIWSNGCNEYNSYYSFKPAKEGFITNRTRNILLNVQEWVIGITVALVLVAIAEIYSTVKSIEKKIDNVNNSVHTVNSTTTNKTK